MIESSYQKKLPTFHLWFYLNYLYYLGFLKQDYSHQKIRKSLSLIHVMRKYLQLKDTITNSWLYDRPPKQNTLNKTSFVYFLSKKLSCKLFNPSTPPLPWWFLKNEAYPGLIYANNTIQVSSKWISFLLVSILKCDGGGGQHQRFYFYKMSIWSA